MGHRRSAPVSHLSDSPASSGLVWQLWYIYTRALRDPFVLQSVSLIELPRGNRYARPCAEVPAALTRLDLGPCEHWRAKRMPFARARKQSDGEAGSAPLQYKRIAQRARRVSHNGKAKEDGESERWGTLRRAWFPIFQSVPRSRRRRRRFGEPCQRQGEDAAPQCRELQHKRFAIAKKKARRFRTAQKRKAALSRRQ